MQPGVSIPLKNPLASPQKRITRFATKATIAPPKIINLLRIVNAPAQATHPMPRKSAFSVHKNMHSEVSIVCTRVRCLDCSMRFSQNAKLLSPQGLFISSIDHQEPSFSLQYLAPLQIVEDLLFARQGGRKRLWGSAGRAWVAIGVAREAQLH